MDEQTGRPINARHRQEYEKLRAELLDLSRRNPMLNYKHRPGSRQQLRLVNTTLDFALSELAKEQRVVTLRALPAPPNTPSEELTDEFVSALSLAKVSDVEYLTRLEALKAVVT